eukprot:CAMPEP_0119041050 /NCGR_PEP_ID=MMETSP1177-20130426/11161_1 /TAXON_ID=2985 /ORGANISM="Ochromonas sp, Strain CCMP1899" /LENGTH=539 /DNA_ID=CAMNT_0007006703 /DNA_START=121 /DNA_END=1737 /DNA_ORIENTATION=+
MSTTIVEPETVVVPETVTEPETEDDNNSFPLEKICSSLLDLVQEENAKDNDEIASVTIIDDINAEAVSLTNLVQDEQIVKILSEVELIQLFTINSEKFGVDHISTSEVVDKLVPIFYDTGRYNEAEPYIKIQLNASKRINGASHTQTLAITGLLVHSLIMTSKFREASLLLKAWITNNSKHFGPDHLETLVAKGYQAACLGKLGKDNESAIIFRDILSSLERNAETDLSHQFKATFSLAEILLKMDAYAEAEGVFESLIEMGHILFEANDPGTLLNAKTLASLKYRLEKRNEAEVLYKWVLQGYEGIFGYNHHETLTVLIIYADLLFEIYKMTTPNIESARETEGIDLGALGELYERILLIQQETNGVMSEQSYPSTLVIGEINELLEKYDIAESFYVNALKIIENIHGLKHPLAISGMNSLAHIHLKQMNGIYDEFNKEKFESIIELLQKVLSGRKRILGPVHEETIATIILLSSLYVINQQPFEAVEILERAHNACARSLGKDDPRTLAVAFDTAKMQLKTGDANSAEESLNRILAW